MAKQYVYAVYDTAAQMYLNPMHFNARGLAPRSFADEVNRAHDENIIFKHPNDFELHFIAEFDTIEGTYITPPKPERVARAIDLAHVAERT